MERVHAIIRLRAAASVSEDEMTAHCAALIANHERPRSCTFRTAPLRLSGTGKILKTKLRKPFWEGVRRRIG